jgi:multiple sugar transport system ATP-binding protein
MTDEPTTDEPTTDGPTDPPARDEPAGDGPAGGAVTGDAATAGEASAPRVEPAGIRLEEVGKRFRGGVEAVRGVSLDVAPGEFLVLVGPSGCGKSTLLRLIAGLEELTAGRIHIGDADVTTQLPQQRDVAMVFQSYALYPRMSVRRNLAFGLRMRRVPRAERDRRVEEVARVLGLDHLLDRRPAALSGGQRQRVAMGRAIVREPRVFLMDEPLSNLDAKLRVSMRAQLLLLHQRLGVTTVYVTHDQVEAMTLGQRVAVLREGTLQQIDTPQRLYHHPVNLFVAAFIGSPSMNLAEASVERGAVRLGGTPVPLPDGSPLARSDRKVIVGVRPSGFSLVPEGGDGVIEAVPHVIEDLGDERYVVFDVDAPAVDTEATRAAVDAQAPDDALLLPGGRARFTARLPTDAPISLRQPVHLAVDPGRLHFFDPETGTALPGG